MASKITRWLFPNYYIQDDTNRKVRVTGSLVKTLDLSGFNLGRSTDSWPRKLVLYPVALILLMSAILSMQWIANTSNRLGCWAAPFAILLIFLIFHQLRLQVGKGSDEEELQQAAYEYKTSNPNQCPACDGDLVADTVQQYFLCNRCGAAWLADNDAPPQSKQEL